MAIRLAVSQRTIKQLNKKISAMEAAGVLTQDLHATQLREKVSFTNVYLFSMLLNLFHYRRMNWLNLKVYKKEFKIAH